MSVLQIIERSGLGERREGIGLVFFPPFHGPLSCLPYLLQAGPALFPKQNFNFLSSLKRQLFYST